MKRIFRTGTITLIVIFLVAACTPFFEGNIEFNGQLSFGSAPDRDMVAATETALAPILRTPVPTFTPLIPVVTRNVPTRPPLPTLMPTATTTPLINNPAPNLNSTATALANLFRVSPTPLTQDNNQSVVTDSDIEIVTVINAGNINGEGIRIRNTGEVISLAGWCIHDEDGNLYTFGAQEFATNAELTVFTHEGRDTPVFLYWGLNDAVWESGETISLRDELGNLITTGVVP